MNLLFLDLETTGLDSGIHEIIQIGGIIEVNNEFKEEFLFNCKPTNLQNIDKSALEINHITIEDLVLFEPAKMVQKKIDLLLKKYAPLHDTWTIVGQNAYFDYEFFKKWWNFNSIVCAKTFRDSFNKTAIDLINIAQFFKISGLYNFPNFKLITLIETLGLQFEGTAHNALDDIRMTRAVFKIFLKHLEYFKYLQTK